MIRAFGDPDAAGRRDVCTLVCNGDSETLDDSPANGVDAGRRMTFGKQNDEFVAAEPGDAIGFSRDRAKTCACFDQQRITVIIGNRRCIPRFCTRMNVGPATTLAANHRNALADRYFFVRAEQSQNGRARKMMAVAEFAEGRSCNAFVDVIVCLDRP
jgi:hypothetical protein